MCVQSKDIISESNYRNLLGSRSLKLDDEYLCEGESCVIDYSLNYKIVTEFSLWVKFLWLTLVE